jgi:hypothetical protein
LSEEGIEIEYRPIRKVVILELLELTSKELFNRISAIRMAGQPLPLNWAEGIVFFAMPASAEITEVDENIMKGTAYFSAIMYSSLPKYQPMAQVGVDKIPIIDQSKNRVYTSITKWLKQRIDR